MKMLRSFKLLRPIASSILMAFGLLFLSTSVIRYMASQLGLYDTTNIVKNENFNLDFFPTDLKFCNDIFSFSSYNMSTSYYSHLKEFNEATQTLHLATGKKMLQGHSGTLKEQTMVIHILAGHPFVKTICETGFNMGHSSFNYLTANPHATVHSFDLGLHEYSHAMSVFLKALFPGRFSIQFGNSKETIPKFIDENPEVKCDVILVDGGHSYDVATSDFFNFARISNLERNVIMFDDYPTSWAVKDGLDRAWKETVDKGIIKESVGCTFKGDYRGFVIGKFMRRP